jgi:hypothetical protein
MRRKMIYTVYGVLHMSSLAWSASNVQCATVNIYASTDYVVLEIFSSMLICDGIDTGFSNLVALSAAVT